MTGPPTVLLLGGTTEATAIATELGHRAEADRGPELELLVSFAGRTTAPSVPYGRTRTGGFGGVDGLIAALRAERVLAVVDALHPFAAVMPFHAHDACQATAIPLVKVVRPPWSPEAGDAWTTVGAMADAPGALAATGGRRALLTVGRQDLDPFRLIEGIGFVVRSIEAADLSGAWDATGLLDRGPFTVDDEVDLLRRERIDVLVTKNSGGTATAAKLTAAHRLSIPVVVIDRPTMPAVQRVATAADAIAWLDGVLAGDQPSG